MRLINISIEGTFLALVKLTRVFPQSLLQPSSQTFQMAVRNAKQKFASSKGPGLLVFPLWEPMQTFGASR